MGDAHATPDRRCAHPCREATNDGRQVTNKFRFLNAEADAFDFWLPFLICLELVFFDMASRSKSQSRGSIAGSVKFIGDGASFTSPRSRKQLWAATHRTLDRHRAEVLPMDARCSALDPIATRRIEDMMNELKARSRSLS